MADLSCSQAENVTILRKSSALCSSLILVSCDYMRKERSLTPKIMRKSGQWMDRSLARGEVKKIYSTIIMLYIVVVNVGLAK